MFKDSESQAGGKTRVKGIQSIEVGYRVLLAVQRGPSPVKLNEIARRAELSPGAAHNYLVSLARTGLVEQEHRGGYRLGPSAFALSLASFQQLTNYDVMRDATRRLHHATGAPTAASVWSQAGPVSVYKESSEAFGVFEFRTGLVPILKSAAAIVFAVHLPQETIAPLIAREFEKRGMHEIEISDVMVQMKAAMSPRGFALTTFAGDLGEEIAALAAPVFGVRREIGFTLSLLGLANKIHPDSDDRFATKLLEEAAAASELIQHGVC